MENPSFEGEYTLSEDFFHSSMPYPNLFLWKED